MAEASTTILLKMLLFLKTLLINKKKGMTVWRLRTRTRPGKKVRESRPAMLLPLFQKPNLRSLPPPENLVLMLRAAAV